MNAQDNNCTGEGTYNSDSRYVTPNLAARPPPEASPPLSACCTDTLRNRDSLHLKLI